MENRQEKKPVEEEALEQVTGGGKPNVDWSKKTCICGATGFKSMEDYNNHIKTCSAHNIMKGFF